MSLTATATPPMPWRQVEEPDFTIWCESVRLSTANRRRWAGQGVAMKDGSYPIPNPAFLRKAIHAIGRGTKNAHSSIKAHIVKRARALGKTSMLPKGWGIGQSAAPPMVRRKLARPGTRGGRPPQPSKSDPDPDKDGDNDTQPYNPKTGKGDKDDDYVEPNGKPGPKAKKGKKKLNQEGATLQTFLTLDSDQIPGVTILQEPAAGESGSMRMKVPFYVGGSKANAQGFRYPILWQESVIPRTVERMKGILAQQKQHLTVYGRHAHAHDGQHLPPGAVVDVVQEGRVGYAVLEIEPTTDGKDIQVLARAGKLNSVSLRAAPTAPDGKPGYKLALQKVNGEPMLVCEDMCPSGIDFAPDGPAQPTWGVQILNEAIDIAPLPQDDPATPPHEEEPNVNLTLEALRSDHQDLVQAIEEPLQTRVVELEEKLTKQKERRRAAEAKVEKIELEAFLDKAGARLPEDKRPLLKQLVQGKTKGEAVALVADLMLQVPVAAAGAPAAPTPEAIRQEVLQALMAGSGNGQPGQGIDQDGGSGNGSKVPDLSIQANLPD